MELIDKSNEKILEEYERFAASHCYYTQSLKWKDVKSNWDWDAVISRDDSGNIRAVCMVLIRRVPVVKYSFLYAPHGFVGALESEEVFLDLFEGIKQLAKKYKAYQFMFDPHITEDEVPDFIKKAGFQHEVNAPRNATIQVRENYLLELKGKTADDVFAGFNTKYRTKIRKAIKEGVDCKPYGTEVLDDFYEIMKVTGVRDGITIRSKDYYAKIINSFSPEQCRLFMCYIEEDGKRIPLCGSICLRYGGKTVYAYSGSADHNRNYLYPNYLQQWSMIQWAIEGGCDYYDFGGIPYYWDENNRASGVYNFKKGFSGEIVTYAGEFSYTFKPLSTKLLDVGRRLYTRAIKLFGTKRK